MYKVIQISIVWAPIDVENLIKYWTEQGYDLEFMTDAYMVFKLMKKTKKNE
jgi:hypothetical protein